MTNPGEHRHIEIKDGDKTVAAAEVSKAEHDENTARASLLPSSGHVAPGTRTSLVDAVLDAPEVKESTRLEATLPLGDTETLDRLRERTEDTTTRPAGSTALLDASIPGAGGAGPAAAPEEPDGGATPES